jgi:integrase
MKYPTTRFVFDRKNTATKKVAALIQIEVLLQGKKKYISTGVKVFKDQWNDKSHVINCNDMIDKNNRIDDAKEFIDSYIQQLIKDKTPFDWDAFARYLNTSSTRNETFIDYIHSRIEERTDIKDSTKKSHSKILTSLMEFGKLTTFEELTKANIADYYEWMLSRDITKLDNNGTETTVKMSQQTVWGYMKILRTYIHDAILHEKIDKDPSQGIKVKRGNTEQTRWLSEEEIDMIEKGVMPNGSLTRVRDLFIFSCYTGLAYSDLMDFNIEKIEEDGEDKYLYGHRKKTGEEYIVLILPQALQILEKYKYKLPKYSNQQYNHRLKDVAKVVGIDKPISSHYGRHTAGMLFLNNGISIEVVAKVLGHSTIRETQRVYASVLKKTVVKEMNKLKKKEGV